jgi:hypothetical protein
MKLIYLIGVAIIASNMNVFALSPAKQISEYSDCSDTSFEETTFDFPLTLEEKTKKLDDAFYGLILEENKCAKLSFSNSRQSNGGGSSGSLNSGSSAGSETLSLSKNLLESDEQSIAIDGSINQLRKEEPMSESSFVESSNGQNGREHLELQNIDNRKILRMQIKEQAELESDPEVKRKLIEQFEALE